MTWFITRVELHNATGDDYEKLHREMEARVFHRTITDDSGGRLRLPTAMYFSQSFNLDVVGVKNLAVEAANATGLRSWIFTCKTDHWASDSLPSA